LSIAAGSWPVWNPYVSSGQPLLGYPNSQVFYPPTWLNLVMRIVGGKFAFKARCHWPGSR
jgi:hypothetical protein